MVAARGPYVTPEQYLAMERVADSGALPVDLVAYPDVLEVENPESAVIFCNTKPETETVCAALDRKSVV